MSVFTGSPKLASTRAGSTHVVFNTPVSTVNYQKPAGKCGRPEFIRVGLSRTRGHSTDELQDAGAGGPQTPVFP